MQWRIPLADIDMGVEEEQAVLAVLRSRWLTMGAVTLDFEQRFAEFVGARHAFTVANGTAALHLACLAVGLQPGDQAIVPSLSFVATANAVRYTGAEPVFADITSLDDLTLSPEAVERAVTARTRAIVVMHYGGNACDMPAILEIARRHGLAVIEDAAHAAGGRLEGRGLGTWGDLGCFSLFSNKNMTTGEGGMITTDDDRLAEKVRVLRSHGMTTLTWDRHKGHAWSYDVVDLGYNYRLDEIRSALGREQLLRLPGNNARRAEICARYRALLAAGVPALGLPFGEPRGLPAYHIFPVLLPPGADRTAFMEAMKARGIQTSIHYPPIHRFSAYQNGDGGQNLALTEAVGAREVTLPLYPGLSDDDIAAVAAAAGEALAVQASAV